MKHEPSGASSDLDRARDLSRRLTAAPGTSPGSPSSGLFTGCARLPRLEPAKEPSTPERPPSREAVPDLTEPGARGWERLLGWLRDGSGCEAAFVMDSSGLLIASSGGFDPEMAEPIGARLLGALGHCRAMTPPGDLPILAAALGERQVTVFEAKTVSGLDLLVGLVAAQPVPAVVCRSIASALLAGASKGVA